jgi:hypothetical protein
LVRMGNDDSDTCHYFRKGQCQEWTLPCLLLTA